MASLIFFGAFPGIPLGQRYSGYMNTRNIMLAINVNVHDGLPLAYGCCNHTMVAFLASSSRTTSPRNQGHIEIFKLSLAADSIATSQSSTSTRIYLDYGEIAILDLYEINPPALSSAQGEGFTLLLPNVGDGVGDRPGFLAGNGFSISNSGTVSFTARTFHNFKSARWDFSSSWHPKRPDQRLHRLPLAPTKGDPDDAFVPHAETSRSLKLVGTCGLERLHPVLLARRWLAVPRRT
ncbi:hypothetical protein SISNIDRAFT_492677 [Sistotremastrum niveocremeum HHB9708]|uniref:Uncharacterized protein n=1 Tax=Sistotremastrum niveocremeum HHB9708 TaxID=1314777 RepID=A0A165A1H3_9AGAM|nr:hypothetical protein SISNIDRAFT_492677 [Sistotremastrum niveocremeum HHB9708]